MALNLFRPCPDQFLPGLGLVLLLLAGCSWATGLGSPGGQEHDLVAPPYSGSAAADALYYFGKARLQAADGQMDRAVESLEQAVAKDPQSAFLKGALARLYFEIGEPEKAIRSAEDALILAPDSPDLLQLLGNIYFSQGRNSEAVHYYRRFLERAPEREEAYLHLGLALARAGEMTEATSVFKELLAHNPESLIGLVALARIYRETGLTVLAEDYYRKALALEPRFDSAAQELGMLLVEKGEVDSAVSFWQDFLKDNPHSLMVRRQLVQVLVETGRYDQALDELHKILDQNPDDLETRARIGLIYLQQRDWQAAAGTFAEILKDDPGNERIAYYLGSAREEMEDWSGALEAFRKIPADSDLYGDALTHRSYLHHRLGQTKEAIKTIEERLRIEGGRVELYSFLASLYESRQEFDQALAVVERGQKLFPESGELAYHRGLILERLGRRADAMGAMRRAIQLEPEHAEAMNFIAYAYAEEGEHLDEALQLAQQALELSPQAHIRDTLAWVYYRLGRLDEARSELEKALGENGSDPLMYEHLGDVYRDLGLSEKAIELYRQAIERGPGAGEAEKKLKALTSGGKKGAKAAGEGGRP